MENVNKRFYLFLLGLIFFTGCFNHTMPTVKRLQKNEKMWGASFGIPFFTSQPVEGEETPASNPIKELGWSLWYGNGIGNDLDCYIHIGELGGIGILFNKEVRESSVSSVVLNYGIGTVNGIYGFRPKIGINYSDGSRKEGSIKKQVGFLTSVAYEFNEENPELIGDYELYGGFDHRYGGSSQEKGNNHFYFTRLGIQKVNKFSNKFSEISKWGTKFLSYKEWAKAPYHLNVEAGFGSIKR